jgi:hypothetical protein
MEEPRAEGMEPVSEFLDMSRKVKEDRKSCVGMEPVILLERRFK